MWEKIVLALIVGMAAIYVARRVYWSIKGTVKCDSCAGGCSGKCGSNNNKR